MSILRFIAIILAWAWVVVFGLGTWVLFVLDQTGVVVIEGNPLPALVMSVVFTPIFVMVANSMRRM